MKTEIAAEMDIGDAFARIVRSSDNGPIRRILNGRRSIRTGTFISFKADLRAMPWESYKGELAVLKLAEAAAGIAGLLAQPHRLEIYTRELRQPLLYFPDLQVSADDEFLAGLQSRTPFVCLAAGMRLRAVPVNRCRTAIIEVKLPDDPRRDDPFYNQKIRLAAEVYRRLNMPFLIIERTADFPPARTAPFQDLFTYDRHTKIDHGDYNAVSRMFGSEAKARPYGEVAEQLGGGSLGRAKILALQLRRKLSINLSDRITDDSKVLYVRWS
ncbi:hypothetical protein E0H39_06995 [Rhizobium leguminosarum bv. viciae]|uniref:hypothetical protein n=1 Tax=Rhizobium leguminosarum TaxID=384 RepID=UPI00102F8C31|nr:hypothetical protein [Rhizobium leguminosarum]TAY13991.1 hypothetical protein ELH96_20540 [Rhizobium leguminosarum]TBY65739.1 hypothetical protein E0H39_06995 [Rhizobium leguminosarum bv. viciae]